MCIDYIDFRPKKWWIVGIFSRQSLGTQIGSMADGMGFAGLLIQQVQNWQGYLARPIPLLSWAKHKPLRSFNFQIRSGQGGFFTENAELLVNLG